jgi:hypothetical protein
VGGSDTGIASHVHIPKSFPENPERTPGQSAAMAVRQRLFRHISEGMVPGQLPRWDPKMGE